MRSKINFKKVVKRYGGSIAKWLYIIYLGLCSGLSITFKNRKSFSQLSEDIIISWVFEQIGIDKPRYLDIGANDPIFLNNTYYFYIRGASGVCVEPNPILCKKIKKIRPRDVCLNAGVSSNQSGTMEFWEFDPNTLSTFSAEEAMKTIEKTNGQCRIRNKYEVLVMPIKEIIERYMDNKVDLLSLDIEGGELDILKEIDYMKCKPVVVCVEASDYMQSVFESSRKDFDEFLFSKGYILYADNRLNKIYLDSFYGNASKLNDKDCMENA